MSTEQEREAFRAGFLAVWNRPHDEKSAHWSFDGPSAADKEPEAWAAWVATASPAGAQGETPDVCTCRHDSGCSSECERHKIRANDLGIQASEFWHPEVSATELRMAWQAASEQAQKAIRQMADERIQRKAQAEEIARLRKALMARTDAGGTR